MSTPIKWLVMLVIWLIYSTVTFKFCIRESCCVACDTTEVTTTPPPVEEAAPQRFPVDSRLGYADVYKNDDFLAWKDQILAGMKDGETLEIEGLYYASETPPEGFENMGLARAQKTIDLLAEFIPRERMVAKARLLDGQGSGEGYFLSANANWVAGNDSFGIIETAPDEFVILFPNASDQEVEEASVLQKMDEVAAYLKDNPDAKVSITGHASRTGDSQANVRFSRNRAKRVARMFRDRGVADNQIMIDHKGDRELAVQGDTEAAHRRNRRAVVKIITPN